MGCGVLKPLNSSENSNIEYTANSKKLPKRVLKGFGLVLEGFGLNKEENKAPNSSDRISNNSIIIPQQKITEITDTVSENLKISSEKIEIDSEKIVKNGENQEKNVKNSVAFEKNADFSNYTEKIPIKYDLKVEEINVSNEKIEEDLEKTLLNTENLSNSTKARKSSGKLTLKPLEIIGMPIKDFEFSLENLSEADKIRNERLKNEEKAKMEALEYALEIRLREERKILSSKDSMHNLNIEAQKILKKYK